MRSTCYLIAGGLVFLAGCQTLPQTQTQPQSSSLEDTLEYSRKPTGNQSLASIQEDVVQAQDLWQKLALEMKLPIADSALVDEYRQWYIKHPKHLKTISRRAAPFLQYIIAELEKNNLPLELALLPIVESAYNPMAVSPGQAAGLWQLTLPTAGNLGIKMNWWYDGRRDVATSTAAAIKLLTYLHKKMDANWLYAIAAYNTGEGRVLSAIKQNKARGKSADFWSLALPKTTRHYVPQLLALADVIKNADKYGIKLTPINDIPRLALVNTESQMDLSLAAEMAQISIEELKAINPGFSRWATSPVGPHQLFVPIEKAKLFNQALAKVDSESRLNWVRYKIKSGDSISEIADQFETSAKLIRSSNGLGNNSIVAGRYLIIPVAAKDPDLASMSNDQVIARKPQIKTSNAKLIHKIRSGDSLWEIAKKYGVSIPQISKWNQLTMSSKLQIGRELTIWANEASTVQASRIVNYKVRSGDSLARIAARYKVTVTELVEWNSLQKNNYLQPGQILKLVIDNQATS
ncbi:LysM peptidoglycan-binding domain-containing protein [Shewanella sp. SR44-3]|uniref:LysM peptidoglycan-binding domain-containing protein n=1 Tax=unclassified Shewanella TaxID=196818 RepID=UPI0015FD0A19|nr:LysM peptidoglycan-binding domain-containing protein [Shewanella sp. SR44-3]MBB1267978.1 LysM peptidoglycan-binding domain-containing protein [Shewanella sp. SR44-3]